MVSGGVEYYYYICRNKNCLTRRHITTDDISSLTSDMILARAHMKRHFIEDPDMDILCSRSFLKRLKLEEVGNFNFTKFSGRSHQIFETEPRVIESHTLSCQDISCISIEGSHQAVSDPCDMMHQKDRVLPTNRSAVVQKLILIRDQQDLSTKANLCANFNSLNSTLRELHRQREDRRLSKKDNVTGNIGYSSSLRVPEQSSTIILSNFVSERAQHSPNKVSKQHKFRIDYESRMLIENQQDSKYQVGSVPFVFRSNQTSSDHQEVANLLYKHPANLNENNEMEID